MKIERQKDLKLTIPKNIISSVFPNITGVSLFESSLGLIIKPTTPKSKSACHRLTKSGGLEIRPSWISHKRKIAKVKVFKSSIIVS